MRRALRVIDVLLITSATLAGQNYQSQSSSTIAVTGKAGQQTIEIHNVAFVVTGTGIPGRPKDESLVLRTTVHSRQVHDEVGMEASSIVEAWPLGTSLQQKPLYTFFFKRIHYRKS